MSEWRRRLARELADLEIPPERLHDLVEELVQDLEERARIARSQGAEPEEAEARAWAGLGSLPELRARLRELEGDPAALAERESPVGSASHSPLRGFGADLRHAFRTLRRAPGFTAAALLTLGLGIGANTALFSLTNAIFLEPLPVAEPEGLVSVFTSEFRGPRYGRTSYPDLADVRDHGPFASLAGFSFEAVGLRTDDGPTRVWAEFVTGDYFETLGLDMGRGRPLGPEDDRESAPPAIVVSHGLWQRQLGGDPSVLGRNLSLAGTAFTVVGVAPEPFRGLLRGVPAEAWIPLALRERIVPGSGEATRRRDARFLSVVARLGSEATVAEATAQLDVLARRLHGEYPDEWTDEQGEPRRFSLLREAETRLAPGRSGPVVGFLLLLGLVVGTVLLIACANVANLMLARASTRRREMAVRLALGASRPRVIAHFVAESLVVAALGGALGVSLAAWASRALTALSLPTPVPMHLEVAVDTRVLFFAVALTLLTGLVLGVAPGLQSARSDLLPSLRDEGSGIATGRQGRRLRALFVTAQVALSTVLLIGASLLLRGLARATDVTPGFDVETAQLVPVDLGLVDYDVAQTADLIDRLDERLPRLPGMRAASLTVTLPLELHVMSRETRAEGYVPRPGEDQDVYFGVVGPGHFEALHIPILNGRGFTPEDRMDSPRVAIVNERFVERFWPGENPIGKRLRLGEGGPQLEVVGLARDSKYRTLGEEPMPFYYVPLVQEFDYVRRFSRFFPLHVVARGDGDPGALTSAVIAVLRDIDPDLPVYPGRNIRSHLGLSLLPSRVASSAFAAFGLLGLLLVSLGLYGVVAYSVARRTQEIGVRLTLGASNRDVLLLVLRDGIKLALVGVLVGAGLAVGLVQSLRGLLFGLDPLDPISFGLVPLLLAAITLVASALPARRAGRVDPVVALHYE